MTGYDESIVVTLCRQDDKEDSRDIRFTQKLQHVAEEFRVCNKVRNHIYKAAKLDLLKKF